MTTMTSLAFLHKAAKLFCEITLARQLKIMYKNMDVFYIRNVTTYFAAPMTPLVVRNGQFIFRNLFKINNNLQNNDNKCTHIDTQIIADTNEAIIYTCTNSY